MALASLAGQTVVAAASAYPECSA